MRARILLNPTSGRGRGARALPLVRDLAARRDVGLAVTGDREELAAAARAAVAEGVDRLVVAGGDGTVHQVLAALAGTSCALGILPLGTGDDLAGALGLPGEPAAALDAALEGPMRCIDLGRADGRLYAGVAGIGFDSEVARTANEEPGWLRGRAVYVSALLRVVGRYRAPWMKIAFDGGGFEGRALFAVAANSPRYGGGMRIAPAALLDDGLLDLVVVRDLPRRRLLAVFPRVFSGRHIGHPAVFARRTPWVRIACEPAASLAGDGEPIVEEARSVFFTVEPGALLVAAPPPAS